MATVPPNLALIDVAGLREIELSNFTDDDERQYYGISSADSQGKLQIEHLT